MSRILYTWELGNDYGHLARFFPIGKALVDCGHEVYFAVKDLAKTRMYDWPDGVHLIQAPIWHAQRDPYVLSPQCFPEILIKKGFRTSDGLMSLSRAWFSLFKLISPDLMIFDHSPVAMFAARALTVPKIINSNPFVTPPSTMPSLKQRPWAQGTEERIEKSERHVLNVMNNTAMNLGLTELKSFTSLYEADRVLLSGFKALDFYGPWREHADYLGANVQPGGFAKPTWLSSSQPKVFAYLKFGAPQSENVLSAFAEKKLNVTCFYSGAEPEQWQQFLGSSLNITNKPFDLSSVFNSCDAIVCHGGIGTVHSALHFGCPMLLLPNQVEQFYTALAVSEIGAGIYINKDDSADIASGKIDTFFNNSQFLDAAGQFAQTVASNSFNHPFEKVCDACDEFLSF